MGIILWIICGAVTSWVASYVLRVGPREGPFLNVGVGVAGAAVGGYLVTHYFGRSPIVAFSLYNVLAPVFTAVVLISLVRSSQR